MVLCGVILFGVVWYGVMWCNVVWDCVGIDILSVAVNTDSAEIVPVTSVGAHTSNCYGLKIDKQHRNLALGSADFLVSLWDLEDMVCYNTISCMDSPIRAKQAPS